MAPMRFFLVVLVACSRASSPAADAALADAGSSAHQFPVFSGASAADTSAGPAAVTTAATTQKVRSGAPCSTNADCGGTDRCLPESYDPPCGMAPTNRCFRDDECPDAQICVRVGHCGSNICAPRCSGCRPQDTCTPTGHCRVRGCTQDGECPPNFMCAHYGVDKTIGECGAKACTRDTDCQGHCLNGYCGRDPGRCRTIMARP
jgi:hypothetical protein